MARQETRERLFGARGKEGSRNCVSKSGRGVGFSGSTRALYTYEREREGGRKRVISLSRARARARLRGSSPWNFNQRQLLAGVARSPYVRTFLETQRQNSIFPPFSSPSTAAFLQPRCNLVVVAAAGGESNSRALPRTQRRLSLFPKSCPSPAAPRASRKMRRAGIAPLSSGGARRGCASELGPSGVLN